MMKILNSYKTVKQQALYKPTIELEKSKLLITELNDSNVSYDLKSELESTQIKCLHFSCSMNDFTLLPLDILKSCKMLVEKYSEITRIKFMPSIGCDPAYLTLLIDSREQSSNGQHAKMALNFMKSIHLMQSPINIFITQRYMPNKISNDISACIYAYIKDNGYAKFCDKFQQYFKPEEAYNGAVNGTVASLAFFVGCSWAFFNTVTNPGYHSAALGACIIATLPTWKSSIYPEFAIKQGEIDFEKANHRFQLTELYKDMGGEQDYQLWDDEKPLCEPTSLSSSV